MHDRYSPAINMKGYYKEGGRSVAIPDGQARHFFAETRKFLDAIKACPTGARLLKEIEDSGHKVDIYRTKTPTGGNSQAGGGSGEFVLDLESKVGGRTVLHHVLSEACEDLSDRTRLQKFFRVGTARPRFLSRDAVARFLGIKLSELKAMESGRRPIPKEVASKMKVYFYDFLRPGPGEDCYVNFNHVRDNLSAAHEMNVPPSHNWRARPPGVALAHELIHAWRVVKGMVLFEYGWEEEAMTVGLPPFSNMDFTENKIRVEWGSLAIRPDYQTTGLKMESGILDDSSKIGIDMRDKSWQGNRSVTWVKAPSAMQQAAAARRKGMGYDDEESEDDWEDDDWV